MDQAQQPRVKDVLGLQIRKWQTELSNLIEGQKKSEENKSEPQDKPTPKPAPSSRNVVKEIKTYGRFTHLSIESCSFLTGKCMHNSLVLMIALLMFSPPAWDQSDKFMKLYVDMKGAQTANSEKVTASFQAR